MSFVRNFASSTLPVKTPRIQTETLPKHSSAHRLDKFVIGSAQQLDPFGFICETIYVFCQSAGLINQHETHQKEEVYVPLPW
jgi:hypothetical protein